MYPSSQPSQPSVPNLFRLPDGNTYKHLFVDLQILGRPALVRTLKQAGAVICSDARQAHIALVDSSTSSGKSVVRQWARVKPVLEYSWASACVRAERLLLANDNWGGFKLHHDGSQLSDEDDDDMCLQNPLPSPRTTPNESIDNPQHRVNNVKSMQSVQDGRRIEAPQSPAQLSQRSKAENTPLSTRGKQSAFLSQQSLSNAQSYAQLPVTSAMPSGSQHFSQAMPITSTPTGSQPMMRQAVYPNMMTPNMVDPNNPLFISSLADVLRKSLMAEIQEKFQLFPHFHILQKGLPEIGHQQVRLPDTEIPRNSPESGSSLAADEGPYLHPERLFMTEKGRRLAFLVQIELPGRVSLVQNIKKHGGTITNNYVQADYVILHTKSKKAFSDLLKQASGSRRPAVMASFVTDCIQKNTILDIKDYLFETPPRTAKRKRPTDEEPTKTRRKSLKSNTEVVLVKQEDVSSTASLSSGQRQESPQLSPPSGSPAIEPSRSRVRYTSEEREYVFKVAERLLAKDPQTTMYAIAKKLHDKVPHRSLQSWTNYLYNHTNIREEFDKMRSIALARQTVASTSVDNCVQPSEDILSVDAPSQADQELDDAKLDFHHICTFFLEGGGNAEGDELWIQLAAKHKCLTASNWVIYYDQHHERIAEWLEKRVPVERLQI